MEFIKLIFAVHKQNSKYEMQYICSIVRFLISSYQFLISMQSRCCKDGRLIKYSPVPSGGSYSYNL